MSAPPPTTLALNQGSSNLRAALYRMQADAPVVELGRATLAAIAPGDSLDARADAALEAAVAALPVARMPAVVIHRIVHGGERSGATRLDRDVLEQLSALSPLAPLHQPHGLALAHAALRRWPGAIHAAAFDTTWSQAMPLLHRLLPLPVALYAAGIRRFGFHGMAFASALRRLRARAPELADGRIVLAHLGGGSSVAATTGGRCLRTSMGLTPLGGVPMATRSGSLDPGVVFAMHRLGMPYEEVERVLWQDSGLRGVSGEPGDMRALLQSGSEGARRAIDLYVLAVAEAVAAMAVCLGGIDALCFSGGVGAHADVIRSRIAALLALIELRIDPALNQANAEEISAPHARVRTFVLQVDEEREMADAARAFLPR